MSYNTLKAAFEHAALARAAYFNLTRENNANLAFKLKESGMTESMADYISKRYKVYDSYTNLNLFGYQGIIFQELDAGGMPTQNYVLANRGTESIPDLVVDIIGIAVTGTNPQTLQMQDLYDKIPNTATSITTTGHSLGGYLSKMALVKWQTPEENQTKKIDFAYTYNGAGINNYAAVPSIWQAFRAFVGLDPQTITNPSAVNYITTENPEFVELAGVHPGEIRMINTDLNPITIDGNLLGHGMANLANAVKRRTVRRHAFRKCPNHLAKPLLYKQAAYPYKNVSAY